MAAPLITPPAAPVAESPERSSLNVLEASTCTTPRAFRVRVVPRLASTLESPECSATAPLAPATDAFTAVACRLEVSVCEALIMKSPP